MVGWTKWYEWRGWSIESIWSNCYICLLPGNILLSYIIAQLNQQKEQPHTQCTPYLLTQQVPWDRNREAPLGCVRNSHGAFSQSHTECRRIRGRRWCEWWADCGDIGWVMDNRQGKVRAQVIYIGISWITRAWIIFPHKSIHCQIIMGVIFLHQLFHWIRSQKLITSRCRYPRSFGLH